MVSGCVVLCDLKHDNEQLYAVSIVIQEIANGNELWKRASRALVFLGLCIADAAQNF